jgi:hypothetical protein
VCTPHILTGFGSLFLRYCHVYSPLYGGTSQTPPMIFIWML